MSHREIVEGMLALHDFQGGLKAIQSRNIVCAAC
jgi:hypothetical protein